MSRSRAAEEADSTLSCPVLSGAGAKDDCGPDRTARRFPAPAPAAANAPVPVNPRTSCGAPPYRARLPAAPAEGSTGTVPALRKPRRHHLVGAATMHAPATAQAATCTLTRGDLAAAVRYISPGARAGIPVLNLVVIESDGHDVTFTSLSHLACYQYAMTGCGDGTAARAVVRLDVFTRAVHDTPGKSGTRAQIGFQDGAGVRISAGSQAPLVVPPLTGTGPEDPAVPPVPAAQSWTGAVGGELTDALDRCARHAARSQDAGSFFRPFTAVRVTAGPRDLSFTGCDRSRVCHARARLTSLPPAGCRDMLLPAGPVSRFTASAQAADRAWIAFPPAGTGTMPGWAWIDDCQHHRLAVAATPVADGSYPKVLAHLRDEDECATLITVDADELNQVLLYAIEISGARQPGPTVILMASDDGSTDLIPLIYGRAGTSRISSWAPVPGAVLTGKPATARFSSRYLHDLTRGLRGQVTLGFPPLRKTRASGTYGTVQVYAGHHRGCVALLLDAGDGNP